MAVALTEESAAVLFDTIDEVLGIFEKEEMRKDDWKYWAVFRQNFIKTYCEEVPSLYWFESRAVPSVTLHASGTSFSVTSELAFGNPPVAGKLYEANKKLENFSRRIGSPVLDPVLAM